MPAMTLEEKIDQFLDAEETPYSQAKRELDSTALPYLASVATQISEPHRAAVAVYIAASIEPADSSKIVSLAAASAEVTVRLAAAGAAKKLNPEIAQPILLGLIDDQDPGVRKFALSSIPDGSTDSELRSKVNGRMNKETEQYMLTHVTHALAKFPSPGL